MTGRHEAFLETATLAATDAAALLRDRFREDRRVERKADGTAVTDADLAAGRLVRETIADRHPDHAVRGEESGRAGDASHVWVVDPLDGTANYVAGFDHYCVSVALLRAGEPLVGVVAQPQRGDIYTAVAGEGARCNGEPIAVSTTEPVDESTALVGISPPLVDDGQFLRAVRRVREAGADCRRLGSGAADLSLVARGAFDCFLDKYTSPWDVAAGSLLVREAGGRVTDWSGDPIDLTAEEREVGVLASTGPLHERLLAVYRDAADAHRR
jgi:myo-inositol-1(or 4)-monophosphatase